MLLEDKGDEQSLEENYEDRAENYRLLQWGTDPKTSKCET